MADEATTTPPETGAGDGNPEGGADEQRVPYERFQAANKKAKEAADRAKSLERDMADLKTQLEERESAGLPELERMKKDLEKAQKRAEDAERVAQEREQAMAIGQRERWVSAAANKLNFVDPDDASRFVDLSEIEDAKDAERAVKRLAGEKKHLVTPDEPNVPGQVLQNGRPASGQPQVRGTSQPGSAFGLISSDAEAEAVGDALRAFRESRKPTQITFNT